MAAREHGGAAKDTAATAACGGRRYRCRRQRCGSASPVPAIGWCRTGGRCPTVIHGMRTKAVEHREAMSRRAGAARSDRARGEPSWPAGTTALRRRRSCDRADLLALAPGMTVLGSVPVLVLRRGALRSRRADRSGRVDRSTRSRSRGRRSGRRLGYERHCARATATPAPARSVRHVVGASGATTSRPLARARADGPLVPLLPALHPMIRVDARAGRSLRPGKCAIRAGRLT